VFNQHVEVISGFRFQVWISKGNLILEVAGTAGSREGDGLGDVLRVGSSSEGGNLLIAFLAGLTAGLLVAVACRGVRRWPGGTLSAPMAQWLGITLILGFTGS